MRNVCVHSPTERHFGLLSLMEQYIQAEVKKRLLFFYFYFFFYILQTNVCQLSPLFSVFWSVKSWGSNPWTTFIISHLSSQLPNLDTSLNEVSGSGIVSLFELWWRPAEVVFFYFSWTNNGFLSNLLLCSHPFFSHDTEKNTSLNTPCFDISSWWALCGGWRGLWLCTSYNCKWDQTHLVWRRGEGVTDWPSLALLLSRTTPVRLSYHLRWIRWKRMCSRCGTAQSN